VLRWPEPMRSSCASAFCIATISSCVSGARGGRTPTASHVRLELALEARPFLGAKGAGKLEDGALGEPGLVGYSPTLRSQAGGTVTGVRWRSRERAESEGGRWARRGYGGIRCFKGGDESSVAAGRWE
jgi:hypothetical protein